VQKLQSSRLHVGAEWDWFSTFCNSSTVLHQGSCGNAPLLVVLIYAVFQIGEITSAPGTHGESESQYQLWSCTSGRPRYCTVPVLHVLPPVTWYQYQSQYEHSTCTSTVAGSARTNTTWRYTVSLQDSTIISSNHMFVEKNGQRRQARLLPT
jgi:hypothetical protein